MPKAINRTVLAGRLVEDPRYRTGADGTPRLEFLLETPEEHMVKGVMKTRTPWHRVVLWREKANEWNGELLKGDWVYVEGPSHSSGDPKRKGESEIHPYIVHAIVDIEAEVTA